MTLQDRWLALRHSKWSTVIPYSLIGVGLAVFTAQFVLMTDFTFEYFSADVSDRVSISDSERAWRNQRLLIIGGGIMAAAMATLLIVRSKWKPPARAVHAIPIGTVAAVLTGTLGAHLLTPAGWTDQVLEGLKDAPPTLWLLAVVFFSGSIGGPYFIAALRQRENRTSLDRINWQMWTAVVAGGLMTAFFAVSMVFGADIQIEWGQYVYGSDLPFPDDSGLRNQQTLTRIAFGFQLVMMVLAYSTKDRKPIHMYAMSASLLLGLFIGVLAPMIIAPENWIDQSLEGLMARWRFHLFLPACMISVAIFASTFGVKMAKAYQARKRNAPAE